ncbi:ubiquitin C-terminal hydrolase 37 [Aspergillus vadensis CBS 113365]|uniref:Ubiquitin carboxyl-terminal hydrolase n=1 Tax=Aspergillus vadensis (strain CBS 113365 / IMI 142717 / IBT 24658) TaxID=1448311 RepID=A0A319AW22_ASPVC|nr:ubiquitin carboxyl-terminal hydrolase [Aspergillus vadensis CBS 113365]PYH63915.1 ubiquitin carboxyl-terminal hydrolase [Aspergillus vadensis CBS 113365]
MTHQAKRRRLGTQPTATVGDGIECLDGYYSPASKFEQDSWNGFCELDSEPAIFNVMLREFGVKGIKIQEVLSLDEEMMAFLNKPIYGLIFLFRWREDDPDKQEASCPEGLWFANQTASNACASVALLNIVNNITNIDLGENLQSFKDFTMPFTPALRGDAISNFEFVKRIHNSFARKMDMLSSDYQLKAEATSKRSRPAKYKPADNKADAGFHFIAFVPALGKVWKFDGLERQPQALGSCASDEDWLSLVKPDIRARMEAYEEDQIEFSILSVARDPLPELVNQLAANVRSLEIIQERLTSIPESSAGLESTLADSIYENTILGPDEGYALTRKTIDQVTIHERQEREYQTCSVEELNHHRQRLGHAQQELRAAIREEQQSQQTDEDYAEGRRYDYGPAIRTWLRFLARKRLIEDLL